MVNLFALWKQHWGTKLRDDDLSVERAESWAAAIAGFDISRRVFNRALVESLKLSWPPSAPADFIELGLAALADEAGYLSAEASFESLFDVPRKAIGWPQHKRDIVTWNAVCRVGANQIMLHSSTRTKKNYIAQYSKILKRVLCGDEKGLAPVPPIDQALIKDSGPIPATKEQAAPYFEQMKKHVGVA